MVRNSFGIEALLKHTVVLARGWYLTNLTHRDHSKALPDGRVSVYVIDPRPDDVESISVAAGNLWTLISGSLAARAQNPINFCPQRLKLFFQDFIALEGVASNLLIYVCGHTRQVSDVSL